MPMRSFRVRGRGALVPSSLTKKAGGRSSGGASLSLSAPSSASMRCMLRIFFVFLRTSSSAFRCAFSALIRISSETSARLLASAASPRASSASASAMSARFSAASFCSSASSRSRRARSASARASRVSRFASRIWRSASRACSLASSKRRTCSLISSLAFSSSPSACAICASRMSTWSAYLLRISSRWRSWRRSTVSSCTARKQR
mmetsp:Transcript_100510/g.313265  ORF Transcript_100510/g.313265 Transcript_100510/m.313265 type:complete len:205 (-) Transcript_100510:742-1356(-)